MKIVVIGGAGAMGMIFGARLAQAGNEVTLFDVNRRAVDCVNALGARITDKEGRLETITNIRAVDTPAAIDPPDLAILFTKCYWTEEALVGAKDFIGDSTTLLSLQNGWGNYEIIRRHVPPGQILVGVNYISGTTLTPGHAKQAGNPQAFIGRVGEAADPATVAIADLLSAAGIMTAASDNILDKIFDKLALNVATLAPSALLKLEAHALLDSEVTVKLMDALLEETVAVAKSQGVTIDPVSRRKGIHDLLRNAVGARSSMLQDVDAGRRTEIDVINGAIVNMGQSAGIPTPVNQSMVNSIKALEQTYS